MERIGYGDPRWDSYGSLYTCEPPDDLCGCLSLPQILRGRISSALYTPPEPSAASSTESSMESSTDSPSSGPLQSRSLKEALDKAVQAIPEEHKRAPRSGEIVRGPDEAERRLQARDSQVGTVMLQGLTR